MTSHRLLERIRQRQKELFPVVADAPAPQPEPQPKPCSTKADAFVDVTNYDARITPEISRYYRTGSGKNEARRARKDDKRLFNRKMRRIARACLAGGRPIRMVATPW